MEGESPLYEWMESGVLRQVAQDEQGTPNVEEVRGRGDGGWSEVEVWEDPAGNRRQVSVRRSGGWTRPEPERRRGHRAN